jgi:hypothetical protein
MSSTKFNNTSIEAVLKHQENTLIKVNTYINLLQRNGYKAFTDDSRDYNINLLAIRKSNVIDNQFSDLIVVFWKYNGVWYLEEFQCTTKPGHSYFTTSYIKKLGGVAMLVPGQYKYKLGLHQNRYEALRQAEPVKVYRLKSVKESVTEAVISTLNQSINIHRASINNRSIAVNKWSAGCIVINRNYDQFMNTLKKSLSIYNTVTLRLIVD